MRREQRIQHILEQQIKTTYIDVEDESYQHNVPEDAETHFKVIMVSDEFQNCSRVVRHRKIYHLLDNEFKQGLKALTLHLYTSEEWGRHNADMLVSPSCQKY